jgi:hypothetical protein
MTMKSRKIFSTVHTAIIVLSLVSSPLAQTPPERLGIEPQRQAPRQTEEEKKAAKELEKKVMALIDRLVEEGMSLRLVENRVHFLTGASDVLWARDEARARALLREAMDQVVAHLRKEKKEEEKEEEKEKEEEEEVMIGRHPPYLPSHFETSHLRHKILNLLMRRDAKLALDFIQLTRPLLLTGNGRHVRWEQSVRADELSLASQIAESDPQTALRIAEEHLNGNLDYQVIHFWGVLQRKDPKAVSKLTEKIINNLKSHDIQADYDASDYVFSVLNVLKSRFNEIANSRNKPDAPQLDSAEIQQTYRDALEIVVADALKVTADNLINPDEAYRSRGLLRNIPNYLTDIEKLLPSRAPAVRAKVAQVIEARHRNPSEKFYAEYGRDLHNKPLQELLALASKAPPGVRSDLYHQAVQKALDQGDKEIVRKSVRENVLDESAANKLLSDLERGNSERTVSEGNLAESRRSLARMSSDEERASAMAGWSLAAAGKGDAKSAREMLDGARSLIGSRMQRRDQLEAQMAVAKAALDLDPGVSFEIAEAAIERLNRLVAAELERQTFEGIEEDSISDGFAWDSYMRDDIQFFTALARKDFDRTINLLKRWQSNEYRLAMSLALVRDILRE